jgi:hypothetical protein
LPVLRKRGNEHVPIKSAKPSLRKRVSDYVCAVENLVARKDLWFAKRL